MITVELFEALDVGDTVILLGSSPRAESFQGVVVDITNTDGHRMVCVGFGTKRECFHTCGGRVPSGQGYNMFKENLYAWDLPAPPPPPSPSLKSQIQTLWEGALL